MPSMVTNYKCPACTGPLHFAGGSGKLECDYCGSTYDVAEIEALLAESEAKAESAFQKEEAKAEAQAASGGEEWDTSGLVEGQWGAEGMRVYNCPSCGAELICDETTAATSCPYCGNTTVVPGQFSGAMKPEFVLPFKLDKAAAVEALGRHYHKKRFLPKTFADRNHIEEVQGVYVPFWLFDGTADASADYEATRSFTRREGQYQVTTTEHYNVHRAGRLSFEKVPVDASVRMPDDHMDSIEPYDYADLKTFSTAYLPGFLADKYDVSAEDSAARADERCENSALSALAGTVTGYETCIPRAHNVRLNRGKVHYALLPVWLLNTKWNGQDFLFAMNGQTGKLVGDLPVDKKRFWTTFAAIALSVAVVVAALLMLAMPAFAEAAGSYVYDAAGVLSVDELQTLDDYAARISEIYDCGVYIAVVDDYGDYGGSVEDTAENIYRDNGFGRGNGGILLLLSMSNRTYDIYSDSFNTGGLASAMLDRLRNDDWYGAFAAYLDSCAWLLERVYGDGEANGYYETGTARASAGGRNLGTCIAIGLVVGCIVALVVCLILRAQMKSVKKATTALVYAVPNSLELYESADTFSHITETRVKVESDHTNRSGGGGNRPGGGSHSGGSF